MRSQSLEVSAGSKFHHLTISTHHAKTRSDMQLWKRFITVVNVHGCWETLDMDRGPATVLPVQTAAVTTRHTAAVPVHPHAVFKTNG